MNWFKRLVQSRRLENELDKELRFHFETQVSDKLAAGMSEDEARRTTRLEFGGIEQLKEDCRESRGTMWIASILQDLRFGARILARSPGFSSTAILVLALGISVSTIAFSLYNLLALQFIPVRDPKTLVNIERRSPGNITPGIPYSSIAFYQDHAKSLSAVMAITTGAPMILDKDEHRVTPSFVTANFFSELGDRAAQGRLFDAATEDSPASPPVAVLSNRYWQRKFDKDPSVVGRTIYLAGRPATIVGVASPDFAGLGSDRPDIWLPIAQHSYFVQGSKPITDPGFDGLIVMRGRLAPGVTIKAAEQELLALTNQLRKIYPAVIWDNEYIVLTPGAHFFPLQSGGGGAPILALVAFLVLLILAVACANLGGLLTARGAARQKEIQTRLDLGARRPRVFRQLFTEALLLAALGALASFPISYLALRVALVYSDAPRWMSALPDWRVFLFTSLMTFIAAVLFGLIPSLRMTRRRNSKDFGQRFVVSAQVAASCVLLILAGLLLRATIHTLYNDPGFGFERVVAINPGLNGHGYTPASANAYFTQLEERLRSLPGVNSVSLALNPPLVNNVVMITSVDVDGRRILIYPNWVSPEFFKTMNIPLLRGRVISANEAHAVVLSQSLAAKVWPHEDPIGKPWKGTTDIVVGVVGNTRAQELNNTDATEIYYATTPSADNLPMMTVLVETSGAPEALFPRLKAIAGTLDPKLYPTITPLTSGFRKNVAQVEQIAGIVSLLGFLALFLAVVGLLGLVTFAVAQRTKEIAIRLAIGATNRAIIATVLRRFAWPVLIGLGAGIAMTAGISQIIRRVLYGISGLDPISYLGAIGLLLAVLFTASLIPIVRALRLDVFTILREE